MDSQGNGEVMRRMVEVFNTGDLSVVDSLVSPDYVDHQGIDGVERFGADGFSNVVTLARRAHPRLRVEVQELTINGDQELTINGDRVVARLIWFESELVQKSTSKKSYEVHRRTIETVRFAGGQAVEHWGERLD